MYNLRLCVSVFEQQSLYSSAGASAAPEETVLANQRGAMLCREVGLGVGRVLRFLSSVLSHFLSPSLPLILLRGPPEQVLRMLGSLQLLGGGWRGAGPLLPLLVALLQVDC